MKIKWWCCCCESCLGRAWLYLALSESSLESYLRLFQENQGLLHKYYYEWVSSLRAIPHVLSWTAVLGCCMTAGVCMGSIYLCFRNALVRSHDHLTLFLTLVSGLEFIRFDLELVCLLPSFSKQSQTCHCGLPAEVYQPFKTLGDISIVGECALSFNFTNDIGFIVVKSSRWQKYVCV